MLDVYLTAQRERAEKAARQAGDELTGAQAGAQEVVGTGTLHR
jgi:hypothetical protein